MKKLQFHFFPYSYILQKSYYQQFLLFHFLMQIYRFLQVQSKYFQIFYPLFLTLTIIISPSLKLVKQKNASISNADILYNYVHNNCPRRFFIDFYGVSSILSTLFMLCGQIVDKLSSVDKFIIFLFLTIPYFIRVCEVIYHNSFCTFCHFHMLQKLPYL